MELPDSPPALVVVAGPIASGKSTGARALADDLRRRGEQVALVELDAIAEMALPTLPDWQAAHDIFEVVVTHWLRAAMTVVVAEGPGSPDELAALTAAVAPGTRRVIAVLTCAFESALARAHADPTRGVSRDRRFLAAEYDRWQHDLPRMPHDVLTSTDATSVGESVALIRTALAATRPPR